MRAPFRAATLGFIGGLKTNAALIEQFKTFVAGVAAQGGKDFTEDVFGGLSAAANLNWRSPNRVLVHIADAPCHGLQYHGWCGKRPPEESDYKVRLA